MGYGDQKIGQNRSRRRDVQRIEPALLDDPPSDIIDLVSELAAETVALDRLLHPATAANLAGLVRMMNAYYSNLIEGHDTRPADIARALAGDFDKDIARRNLQIEAAAHVRVQAEVDAIAAGGGLGEPAAVEFLRWLHREFYKDAPREFLDVRGDGRAITMLPGEWRSTPGDDVAVGRHIPPSSARVADFMNYFEERYRLGRLGKAGRVLAMATAHHRFNYIHPFPDGNGRVSRLMSHAMAHAAGIGAHGLWSISRGLARGLESRGEYRRMMDYADTSRQGDLDGRGNLSERALVEFVRWFLRVCLDQVRFMSSVFALDTLSERLRSYATGDKRLGPDAAQLLEEALRRGQFERGEAPRIAGMPERSARRLVARLIEDGMLASETPKGALSLRFPAPALELLFPRLFPHT